MNLCFGSPYKKNWINTLLFIGLFQVLATGQDTLWVQGFNFNSTTRDSLIDFPDGNHNDYAKILMEYTMRCKDGLISTGSARNKGCGEWDYSCNTNIIDSTMVDSLKTLHPNFVINGVSDFFLYTTKPTYSYYQYKQSTVNVNSSSNVVYSSVNGTSNAPDYMVKENLSKKSYLMIKAAELSGNVATTFSGLQLNFVGSGTIGFMKIKIAGTSSNSLGSDIIQGLSFEEVLNRDVILQQAGKTDLIFHKPYVWNGTQNLIIEISYNSTIGSSATIGLKTNNTAENLQITNLQRDSYIEFNTQSAVDIPTSGMGDIKSQITLSFWLKDNGNTLPYKNSIFNANDDKKNRQLNVHLPWLDGRVYWDCGNDGGGFDRIDKAAGTTVFDGKWNHWAFTKNTLNGSMKIYLNGVLWHSGTGKSKKIDIKNFILGSDFGFGAPYQGGIDDFAVWDKELTLTEIKSIMFQSPNSVSSLNQNLIAFYNFNEQELTQKDLSKNQLSANIVGIPLWRSFKGADVFKSFDYADNRPEMAFIKGNYSLNTSAITLRDSIINSSTKVIPYTVLGTDLVEETPLYYWASGNFPVYDEAGDLIEEINFPEENVIEIENLTYYRKFPAVFELISFVTPYGIGLDLGLNGKKWTFDVIDFGPILKNKKRLMMDKGGQWQEDIDIKFAFISGKPVRDVISIQPIWPVNSYGYTSIIDNGAMEDRSFLAQPEVKSMRVKIATTGHGQEGEFISRVHSLNVNGGNVEFAWNVWTECADNVIFPQGGTWVYDRAGWCPGKPSDVQEFEIMPNVNPNSTFTLDYGLNGASGDSRYIISSHLVKYGDANFQNDAELLDIVSPSTSVIHDRVNPACNAPKIIIKNNGKDNLTSLDIWYGIDGKQLYKYAWTGSLAFLGEKELTLPNLPLTDWLSGDKFIAYSEKPNGLADQYSVNDRKYSSYNKTTHLSGDIVVSMKTNSKPNETKWTLKDDAGNILRSSKTNLQANTVYQDTIKGLAGCYKLEFTDSDDDGISWWANNDGDGYIRARGVNSPWTTFNPDFGKETTFNFTTGIISSEDDVVANENISIYPNPTMDEVVVTMEGMSGNTDIMMFNQLGIRIFNENIENTNPSTHSTVINLENRQSGIYYVHIKHNGLVKTFKVIKI